MLKIAYCDDSPHDRDKIMSALGWIEQKWSEAFEIFSFCSAEALCESLQAQQYDILLMDILMDGMDGIEAAARISAMGADSLIIFISSYDKRIKELFDFKTVAFLDKPLDKHALETALKKACERIRKSEEKYFVYKIQGVAYHVPIREIIFFESRKNNITIKTTRLEDTYRDTLNRTWAKLKGMNRFIMPHKSFIFNLDYVVLKANSLIIRPGNQSFHIGPKFKEDTQLRYLKYLESRCVESYGV